ncbi:YkgJ family cysteine cluster protein [Deinococcus yavapaiensis]|uniref:YkgJ family cysteine cluster protein n=1 Tax=Deinococcus yavapaiensis TaxID=309889 RepID=UPI001FEB1BBB|nr:YkgJ family cysteine cluster protein [Deinococcus yavapaiensis]
MADEGGLFDAPDGYAPRSAWRRECTACGACCAAPDITALNKPLGVPCAFLRPDCLCDRYETRPGVCRNYRPDWVCGEVAPLATLEARVRRFLQIYDLT